MKFGISVATVGAFAEPKVHQELAGHAETNGRDGYFLWDGVAHAYRPVLEPWVGLAAMRHAPSGSRSVRWSPPWCSITRRPDERSHARPANAPPRRDADGRVGDAAVGGSRRADGVCPMGVDRPPREVRAIHDYVARRRTEPFDLAVFASLASAAPAEATDRSRAYAAVGVTWMIETLAP